MVTIIEGKQQTEPLPVSASHWETHLKHQKIELLSEQNDSDWTIQWFLVFVSTILSWGIGKTTIKRPRRGSAKRDISTAGTRNGLKLTVK